MIEINKLAMIDEAAAIKMQLSRKVDQYDVEIPTDGVLASLLLCSKAPTHGPYQPF